MENNNTTQTHVTQKLFTEMLRPQTLDQAIIVPRIREVLHWKEPAPAHPADHFAAASGSRCGWGHRLPGAE